MSKQNTIIKNNKTKKLCKLQKEPNEIFTTEKPNCKKSLNALTIQGIGLKTVKKQLKIDKAGVVKMFWNQTAAIAA